MPKWERGCHDISYTQNKYTNANCPNGLYSVEFTYTFGKGTKEIYFAHSIPYTYTMLHEYLAKKNQKRFLLCKSLAGNNVEYLHITNKNEKKKQVIMLTSRVHPGETGASWMIHGLIDTLLNPKESEK